MLIDVTNSCFLTHNIIKILLHPLAFDIIHQILDAMRVCYQIISNNNPVDSLLYVKLHLPIF